MSSSRPETNYTIISTKPIPKDSSLHSSQSAIGLSSGDICFIDYAENFNRAHFDEEKAITHFSTPLAFTHHGKKTIVNLKDEKYAVVNENRVHIFCYETHSLLKMIPLCIPEEKGMTVDNLEPSAKVYWDGNLLLVNLNTQSRDEDKQLHPYSFIFIVDITSEKIVRIPFESGMLAASFISESRVAIANRYDLDGFGFYDFNLLEGTYKKSNATVFVDENVLELWTWPQHPAIWVVAKTSILGDDLYLYHVKEEKDDYDISLVKKIGPFSNINNLILQMHDSLIFSNINTEPFTLTEFNLKHSESTLIKTIDKITLPLSFFCSFPSGDVGLLGGGVKLPSSLIMLKLKSMDQYKLQDKKDMVSALDASLPINIPQPLFRIMADYTGHGSRLLFFSPKKINKSDSACTSNLSPF